MKEIAENLTITEMQEMQKVLQEKNFERWGGLSPERSISKLLWLHGELGEVSDIIKKKGASKIMSDPEVRAHFVEEMCDVLMYYNDVLICYDITPEELEKAYRQKHEFNMNRW
ncbi:MAG: nucleotide pyrophosphohydrolase [Clostridia bacterium]|nr:nucleotide pyrophosphohydrolase [Clostridia bacterium]